MMISNEYQGVADYGYIRSQSINLAPLMRRFLFMLPNNRLKLTDHLVKILSARSSLACALGPFYGLTFNSNVITMWL
jgi:hypothetical protein